MLTPSRGRCMGWRYFSLLLLRTCCLLLRTTYISLAKFSQRASRHQTRRAACLSRNERFSMHTRSVASLTRTFQGQVLPPPQPVSQAKQSSACVCCLNIAVLLGSPPPNLPTWLGLLKKQFRTWNGNAEEWWRSSGHSFSTVKQTFSLLIFDGTHLYHQMIANLNYPW